MRHAPLAGAAEAAASAQARLLELDRARGLTSGHVGTDLDEVREVEVALIGLLVALDAHIAPALGIGGPPSPLGSACPCAPSHGPAEETRRVRVPEAGEVSLRVCRACADVPDVQRLRTEGRAIPWCWHPLVARMVLAAPYGQLPARAALATIAPLPPVLSESQQRLLGDAIAAERPFAAGEAPMREPVEFLSDEPSRDIFWDWTRGG